MPIARVLILDRVWITGHGVEHDSNWIMSSRRSCSPVVIYGSWKSRTCESAPEDQQFSTKNPTLRDLKTIWPHPWQACCNEHGHQCQERELLHHSNRNQLLHTHFQGTPQHYQCKSAFPRSLNANPKLSKWLLSLKSQSRDQWETVLKVPAEKIYTDIHDFREALTSWTSNIRWKITCIHLTE